MGIRRGGGKEQLPVGFWACLTKCIYYLSDSSSSTARLLKSVLFPGAYNTGAPVISLYCDGALYKYVYRTESLFLAMNGYEIVKTTF